MSRRHPHVPPRWLMTDERMGEALWAALGRLPRGSGVVFRHHSLPVDERRTLYDRVRAVTRRRRLLLSLAGPPGLAAAWRADGAHGPSRRRASRPMLRSVACHDRRALVAASLAGERIAFVSPVFPTRSHPGRRALGRVRLGLLVGGVRAPLMVLGGVDERHARTLERLGIDGWAAIDAWIGAPPAG